ncbi:lebocin-4-like [Helicoverpa zea]|uniref:lebocin-4-like n=1 Tax=Helicoverpa zea TaxID=7113 RepID=UPI001F59E6AF|nr:lebocin-4-like [Helicoverpa zea]
MCKLTLVLCVFTVFLIAESTCQRFILPTYRPPPQPRRPVIMRARRGADDEPLWLYQGDNIERAPTTADHPFLPSVIDDVKLDPNRRYTRSLGTPRGSRGSSGSRPSSNRDTGPTHPGYNRRNARSLHLPGYDFPLPTLPPFNPRPRYPWDEKPPGRLYA